MDTTWSVLAALAFGILLGAGFTVVLHMAERRGQSAARVVSPTIPDGVEQVLDVLESAGVVLDPSNNVLRASPGALAMGLVRNQMLAHPELVELVASVRRTGEPVATELELARGPFSDTTMLLAVRVARLGTRFVLLLADDRTEAARLDDVRRDFIANISHELKTPIASVGLLAEALEEAADEPEQVRRFADRLGVEATRLGHITSDVIELSRLQARDALRRDELLDVDRIVAAAVDQNRVVAASKGVEVRVRAKSRAQVYGDEALLIVAVHNLVANAIAYSAEGGRVGVGVRVDGDAVEISVADQGIGIPAEELDRIFERFYRVDQARSRNTGGTGLGLSIVKHTVQNHGGDVRAWSRPGKGSTFTVRLPLAERPVPTPEKATSTTDGAGAPSAPLAGSTTRGERARRTERPNRTTDAVPAAPARGDAP